MRIEVTKNVARHHTNPDYECLLVHFEPGDAVIMGPTGLNWMPRHTELLDVIRLLYKIDSEFQAKVKNVALTPGDFVK